MTRPLPRLFAVVLAALVVAGCQRDGRELREPTSPLPPPTTTTTTLPPDIANP